MMKTDLNIFIVLPISEFDDSYAKAETNPQSQDQTVLLSPIQAVESTSCLQFLYMTKFANLTVKQYSETYSNVSAI